MVILHKLLLFQLLNILVKLMLYVNNCRKWHLLREYSINPVCEGENKSSYNKELRVK